MADISSELATIHDDPLGRHVKQAIYDALMKVNYDVEHYEPKGAEWPIDHMIVGLFNGYLLPTEVGKMGENPNTECVWLIPRDLQEGIAPPARDSWCVVQEMYDTDTEDPEYETGTITDSGSHEWTKLADYKLLKNPEGTEFSYVHIWITRLLTGESIRVSGDRNYSYQGFLIQDGIQVGEVSVIESELLESLPYPAPRVVGPISYTITAHLVSVSKYHIGDLDTCPIRVMPGMGEAERWPEIPDGFCCFLFLRTDSDPESQTVVFEENPATQEDPFFAGGTAITTFALR